MYSNSTRIIMIESLLDYGSTSSEDEEPVGAKRPRKDIKTRKRKDIKTGKVKKLTIGELRVLIAKALDKAWKNLCKTEMMKDAFKDVGLSLNIDGSQDHLMKFQGQPQGRPSI